MLSVYCKHCHLRRHVAVDCPKQSPFCLKIRRKECEKLSEHDSRLRRSPLESRTHSIFCVPPRIFQQTRDFSQSTIAVTRHVNLLKINYFSINRFITILWQTRKEKKYYKPYGQFVKESRKKRGY